MCNSVPAHIHPHMSKSRLLLETDGGYQRTTFTVGPVHARDHGPGRSVAGVQNRPQGVQEGLIGCPYQDGTRKEGASTLLGRLEAHRSDRKF